MQARRKLVLDLDLDYTLLKSNFACMLFHDLKPGCSNLAAS